MKHSWKNILSLLLAAAMLFALVCPALAVGEDGEEGPAPVSVTWEKIDASPRGIGAPAFELADEDPYGPDRPALPWLSPRRRASHSRRILRSNARR